MNYLKILLIILFLFLFSNIKTNNLLLVNNENNIIDFKNSYIIYKNKKSYFNAVIYNNSDSSIYIKSVDIIIKDSSNYIINTFKIIINSNIESDKYINVKKEVSYDLSDAVSFDYNINY